MSKKTIKSIVLLLVVLFTITNVLTGLNIVSAAAAATSSATFVGIDTTTLGDWNGNGSDIAQKYGKDGYILPGYAQSPAATGWGTSPAAISIDLASTPGYLNSYSYSDTCIVIYPPMSDGYDKMAKTLDKPGNVTPKYKAYTEDSADVSGKQVYTFDVNDSQMHQFSVYVMEWKNYDVQIQDMAGNVLASQAVTSDQSGNGLYVTFNVKGDFKLVTAGDRYAGVCGFFFDPVPAPPLVTTEATFVGSDTSTYGHWEGKYGSDGYILQGYLLKPKDKDWNVVQASPSLDLTVNPSYLDSYGYNASCDYVYPPLSDGYFEKDLTLDMPSSSSEQKYKVNSQDDDDMSGKQVFTFNLNDDKKHIFSMYNVERKNFDVQIQNMNGDVLAHQAVTEDMFANGAYVSFEVKGSFKLVLSGDRYASTSGFFFDTPFGEKATGLAVNYIGNRSTEITWTNQGSPDKMIIERSLDNVTFEQIAMVSGSTSVYTDTNRKADTTYYYKVRNVKGTKYGETTDSVNVTLPPMDPTTLTMLNGDISADLGDEITLSAKFEKVNDDQSKTLLVGKTVTFRFSGEHVGDGISLGQEIPEVLATGVTNDEGVATATITCEYPGSFSVYATTDPDDADNLSESISAHKNLNVSAPVIKTIPVIIKISDAVMNGKSFSINGYGLEPNFVDIAIERAVTGDSPASPSAEAFHPQIVQTDTKGFFVVAKMPENAEPGVYNIWVKNSQGWSSCYKMNAARPLFISDREACNGSDIDIAGRNFDQKEFGGTTNTLVRLNDGSSKTFAATVKSVNPFKITFTVGEADLGSYFVEVSNDGGANWSRLSNGQKLTVVAAGEDPLGLGVAWAKDFNWSNRIDVTKAPYNVNNTDTVDDTAAVQAAVDAAEASGGVVYFPNGSYYISKIDLPSGVVLLGEDEYTTKLYYTGTGSNFIDTKGQNASYKAEKQGVANMSLLLTDSYLRPDSYMWLGEGWGASVEDKTLRKSNRIFVTNVNIDYPTAYDRQSGSGRGIAIEFIADERVLIKDNHFVGWHAQPYINYINSYYILKNNYFEFTEGVVVGNAQYSFYENNHVKVVQIPGKTLDTHGLFARSNAYIANNIVENCGDNMNEKNDGEAICVEVPNAVFNFGSILKATATSITVAPARKLVTPKIYYGDLSVLITDGAGMGQLMKVKNIDNYTINLKESFGTTPDATSKFVLIIPNENATFYMNTIQNNAKGIWLFGNSFDGVVADNTSIDSEGIYIYSSRNSSEGLTPDYFSRVTRNTVTGISRRSKHGGIGFNTARNDNAKYGEIAIYSTEITNNTITGDNTAIPESRTESPGFGGIYAIGARGQFDGVMGTGDATNTIIEGNALNNVKSGIELSYATYGQVVIGNTFHNSVLTPMNDTGSTNTYLIGNDYASSIIVPITASFDKKSSAQADIVVTLDLNGNNLTAIKNGDTVLTRDVDYIVTGSAVTIAKSYLAALTTGTTATLTFDMDKGADPILHVGIIDSTQPEIANSAISPIVASFDKKTSAQRDTAVTLASNGNTLIKIMNGTATLSLGSDFTMEGKTVTIRKEFWESLPIGTYVLTFYMDKGANPTLTVEVKDTTPTPAPTPTTTPTPASTNIIEVKPVLNGSAAEAKVDAATLSKAFDAAVADAGGIKTVTLKVSEVTGAKEYSQQLPSGTFEATRGNEDSTKKITIDTPIGSLVVTDNMFKSNDLKNAVNVSLTIGLADVSGLDKKIKEQIGSKPVVELNAMVNGQKISWNNPKATVTVSLAYQPTAEELKNPECIVVWYIDGKGKVQSVSNARYDAATGKVTFTTTHFSTYAVAYNFETFVDAGKNSWAQKSIEVLASKGIMTGSSETLFSPEKNITRAEFIDGLIKALNLTAEFDSNFSDVAADSEYYTSIGVAKQLGITGGTGNNKFSPAAEITRQDMAALVVKAMKLAGLSISSGTAADLQKFSDSSKVAEYAVDKLATLVKEGILVGSGDKITPAGKVTKAQTAVVLYKLYNRMK